MLSLTFALFLQTAELPPNPSFEYSGTPVFAASDTSALSLRGHSAVINIRKQNVHVLTTTEVKNTSKSAITVDIVVPRRREGDEESSMPAFNIKATWNNAPINLRPVSARGHDRAIGSRHVQYESDLHAKLTLAPYSTYGFRTEYTVPLGHGAADGKLKMTGYALEGDQRIDQVNLSYRTERGVVFRLPEPHPSLGWQVGTSGAFVQKSNFHPGNRLSWVSFYSGGFDGADR